MIYDGEFCWARIDFVKHRGNLIIEIKIQRKFKFVFEDFDYTRK